MAPADLDGQAAPPRQDPIPDRRADEAREAPLAQPVERVSDDLEPTIPQLPPFELAGCGDASTAFQLIENTLSAVVTLVNALVVKEFERERREGKHKIIVPG
jgi:hypothetical protein